MAERTNFLLGYGERLTEPIAPTLGGRPKRQSYTVDEARTRLATQAVQAIASLGSLPPLACPNNEAVAVLTLHPEFIAKSFFPDDLLRAAGLHPVGSRPAVVKPEKWTRKTVPTETPTTELFVAGSRPTLVRWSRHLASREALTKGEDELTQIEAIRAPAPAERLRNIPAAEQLDLEVVLHASDDPSTWYVLDGFEKFASSLGVRADIERRLYAGGLCFLPVRVPKESIARLAQFTFLRVARPMPRLRALTPFEGVLRGGVVVRSTLPTGPPVDPNLRVAVFDGGLPAGGPLSAWTQPIDAEGVKASRPEYLEHGHAVTSALLFGSLRDGDKAARPFGYVDHYRVLDVESEKDPTELYDVIGRIRSILENRDYEFLNMSIGPELPMEDDEVHPWTALLDQHLADGRTLAAFAVGNNGRGDRASGNARVQVPSDCVNGVAIGAADRRGVGWRRAAYSCVGPGRSPGLVKPDIVSFGGSTNERFFVADPTTAGTAIPCMGTSFAAPAALRMAMGVRAHFGAQLGPLALKTLLVHCAEACEAGERAEVGWGRVPDRLEDLVVCDEGSVRVVYQGTLSPAGYLRARLPLPRGPLPGNVSIKATFCFATPTDPQDPGNYTRSGLDIVFRPHAGRFAAGSALPRSATFFGSSSFASESDLRRDAHKWETVLQRAIVKRGGGLREPVFDIHYNARSGGQATSAASKIRYALVVTISCAGAVGLYDEVLRAYAPRLQVLQPVIEIPITL